MFPKWPLLDIVNEANGAEIHIPPPFALDDSGFCDVTWVGRIGQRAFGGDVGGGGYCGGVLGRAEDVREEGVVV